MPLILKSVASARGPRWISDAFRLYARRPLAFTALFATFLFSSVLFGHVPVLGALVQMMSLPLLTLGFMIAGQSALLDGAVHPRQFLEPLRTDAARRRALVILCVSYGAGAVAILFFADAVSDNAWARLQKLLSNGQGAQAEIDALLSEPGVALAIVAALVLGSVLSVPFWHAPALVHWGGQGVMQALFSSTVALWRSRGAFFSYMFAWAGLLVTSGLVTAIVFGMIGAPQLVSVVGVPAGLMLSTVFYISVLFTFNDSFGAASPEVLPAALSDAEGSEPI